VRWGECIFGLEIFVSDDIAIRVRGLGKKYLIGGPQEKYLTFRDAIINFCEGAVSPDPSYGIPTTLKKRVPGARKMSRLMCIKVRLLGLLEGMVQGNQ